MKRILKTFSVISLLAALATPAQAEISSPFGKAELPGGFGLSTPIGGVNIGGFDINTPAGNVQLPGGFGFNTPWFGSHIMGFDLNQGQNTPGFSLYHPWGKIGWGGFGLNTPAGNVQLPGGFGFNTPWFGSHIMGFDVNQGQNTPGFSLYHPWGKIGWGGFGLNTPAGNVQLPGGFGFNTPWFGSHIMGFNLPSVHASQMVPRQANQWPWWFHF